MNPVHINLDDAWDAAQLQQIGIPTIDARPLGPHLRYIAPEKIIRQSLQTLSERLTPDDRLLLYGSGDFHYLAAWWLRRAIDLTHARHVTLLSFDNHPDWDIRPPRWSCGGWINRALEFPEVAHASVWGCGNFELAFPSRLFRNKKALATGKLAVHAWAERQSPKVATLFNCMTRNNWRERFTNFAAGLAGKNIYITLDLDALTPDTAITNWENGLFTPEDLLWSMQQLRNATLIGLDICGACSPQLYARPLQLAAARFDHPKQPAPSLPDAQRVNLHTLHQLWPALTRT
ncbi:MAG TPA: arginase family protein [Phycisphaerae bacterium]|nr:arginase family protein [Phycisphaerae bacterium]